MKVLGIETTCDETAAAVVTVDYDGRAGILSNEVFSQIADHAAYGGVVPEIAARAHVEVLDRIITRALAKAGVSLEAIDAVAAAAGPGLIGGVLVGLTTAKAIALVTGKPLIAVNHLEGHALTARMTNHVQFPYLLLLVSGGHTQLLAVKGVGDYLRLGTTLDDAVGEAFDKTAKLLGLGYPGGPAVEHEAESGDPQRFRLPRPMVGRPDSNFSLSGLKTAVRLEAQKIAPLSNRDVADLCAGFQAAIVDIVADRTRSALWAFQGFVGRPSAVVVAGGVAANQALRDALERVAREAGLPLVAPPVAYCGDNAAMIAWAGLERFRLGMTDDLGFVARPRWPLDERQAKKAENGQSGGK
ncbi:MAG: tRNA (adenosine(37)-N6)-threonylcarbamoyltransferase complex transferase subunit TsaD [Methylobacteriaceae bacterium]|jgi:N6-L-threonylcarbamoyladenine synthase|nr:tRNA (adenosine(37)-N6)-threonylcarbamoyltransferase complex transferase subunit TsaD [Methylobacteriaceae bacterium]